MTIATEAEARASVARLGDPGSVERCEHLLDLLAEENTRQNLVSKASLADAWVRHIADSAQLLTYVPRETPGPWLDLGTGAGFPGLVVAALRPDLPVCMVESRTRRVDWLERAKQKLSLSQARVLGCQLEAVESFPAAAISARAFAPLQRLIEISARFSTSDTIWLLPKGRSAWDEVNQLSGWHHLFHVEQSLTDPDAGVVVGSLAGPLGGLAKARRKSR